MGENTMAATTLSSIFDDEKKDWEKVKPISTFFGMKKYTEEHKNDDESVANAKNLIKFKVR